MKLLNLSANDYQKHSIHNGESSWSETNCYVDLWIELLHSTGFDPVAALPFTFAIDFEGDQWTFFKYPLSDLDSLYGLDVQELNIWKPLRECIPTQLSLGRSVLVELDSFYLPDTRGTAYQIEHVKTTVGVNEFDLDKRYMGYFHNQGYFEVEGGDFEQLFLNDSRDPHVLPPYVEFVKQRAGSILEGEALTQASLAIFKQHLLKLPKSNPFDSFKSRFINDFSDTAAIDLDYFHKYSFATFRQYGACFELCKVYLSWLKKRGVDFTGLDDSALAFGRIAEMSKIAQFQLARTIMRKKPLDLKLLDDSAAEWLNASSVLKNALL